MAQPTHVVYETPAQIDASTLTDSYQSLLSPLDDSDMLIIMSSANAAWVLSIDGGNSDFLIFTDRTSLVLDLRTNANRLPKGDIQVKHNGAAPTSGIITAQVIR